MPAPWFPLLASSVTSPLDPASPQAGQVSGVFILTGAVMTVILALVCFWIGYILLRFRGRPGDADPTPVYGNKKLEYTWTFLPLAIVTWFAILGAQVTISARPKTAAGQRPDVVVIGHQWWWEIHYPASGVVTANEVHVPVGRPILVSLQAADVIHDFWVPQLGPKHDMIPGDVNLDLNHIWLEPREPAVYDGACAEFCGNSHAWMRIRVVAQTQADFDAWQRTLGQPLAAPSTAAAEVGMKAFETNTCRNCHALAGLPAATANVGPDLTNLGDRSTLGAGVLPNSKENLAKWLADPQRYKPGCYMPDFHLSAADLQGLTEYLWRKSGEGLPLQGAAPPPMVPGGVPSATPWPMQPSGPPSDPSPTPAAPPSSVVGSPAAPPSTSPAPAPPSAAPGGSR
jgi:cytochrome c oxidase subunit 2